MTTTPRRHCMPWEEYEVDFLRATFGVRPLELIAEGLNRTPGGVHQKARRLGLDWPAPAVAVRAEAGYACPRHPLGCPPACPDLTGYDDAMTVARIARAYIDGGGTG